MKLATILLSAAFAVAYAQDAGTVAPGGSAASETPAPSTTIGEATAETAAPAASTTATTAGSTSTSTTVASGDSTLDGLKATTHKGEWHMQPIRVVHARVQSDTPKYFDSFYGSMYGKDAAGAYLSGLDTVNTASVEGALMYVQAEGINQNGRSEEDRCVRKNKMRNIVFYEVLIAQTNETIAQYQETWNAPEYGPFLAMDSGACTAVGDSSPVECLMYNGVDGYPNIGPFVGAGLKIDDRRAPYPNNYWFSFPNTCPQSPWSNKTDECRESTRMGLCPVGVAPDGVECTFAYDILGWVTIDDVVGITNESYAGGKYANFTEWCEASEKNIEFKGDTVSGEMEEGLDFWKDPTSQDANAARAKKVIEVYNNLVSGKFESTMVPAEDVARFKPLPTPAELAAANPKCYESVKSCSGGCARTGYSQLCTECTAGSEGCAVADSSFTFPTLAKAPTTKSDDELSSGSALGGTSGTVGKTTTPAPSAASASQIAVASVAAAAIAVLAL
jgi:hypothetical protein